MVADTGCGISADDKEKLFLPYFSTKGRGTGLGLAIVNHILSEHGARIRVEDNRPAGARFYVEVPVTGRGRGGGSRMKNTRVLIVDDEPGIRESLRGVLEDEGYSCHAVESGEKCLEELARQSLRRGAAGRLASGNGRNGNAGADSGDSLRGPAARW